MPKLLSLIDRRFCIYRGYSTGMMPGILEDNEVWSPQVSSLKESVKAEQIHKQTEPTNTSRSSDPHCREGE